MKLTNSGKVITVFSVIVAILLVTLTAISIFYTTKEKEKRQAAEHDLADSRSSVLALTAQVDELKKNNLLLREKTKESDNKINDLSDELELGQGLREEMKKEVASLKEELDKVNKTKDQIKESFNKEISDAKAKIAELESQLALEKNNVQKYEAKFNNLKDSVNDVAQHEPAKKTEPHVMVVGNAKNGVNLDKIVVVPGEGADGKILSVDQETNFAIVNMGENHGVKMGDVMAVYRGNSYLGDIKITRLQPEMAAADFVPPFNSTQAKKDDQVIVRQ